MASRLALACAQMLQMSRPDHRRNPRDGRACRQIRRCFIAANGEPVSIGDLMAWCYTGNRRPWYWPIHRALPRYGVHVRHGWWAPNDALLRQIKGE